MKISYVKIGNITQETPHLQGVYGPHVRTIAREWRSGGHESELDIHAFDWEQGTWRHFTPTGEDWEEMYGYRSTQN